MKPNVTFKEVSLIGNNKINKEDLFVLKLKNQ